MNHDLASRVQRGIGRLDQSTRGWRENVNLADLDMHSSKTGVLEQVFGRYNVGLQLLGLTYSSAADSGFDVEVAEDGEEDMPRWAALTAEWKRQLGDEEGRQP